MKCNCPCHSGAGVMHYGPSKVTITNDRYGGNYSSSGGRMVACPCELNIKIQQLTKDYYEKERLKSV